MYSTPSRSKEATRISAPFITTPRSPEREALVVFGFLLLLDWNFEAMGRSVMSLEGTQRVERQKRGFRCRKPLIEKSSGLIRSEDVVIGVEIGANHGEGSATNGDQSSTFISIGRNSRGNGSVA